MSKRDLGSKLKARLDEWEAYGEQPIALSDAETQHVVHREINPVDLGLADDFALVPMNGSEPADTPAYTVAVAPESRVVELQAALQHERDKSRRLLDAVAREQVQHAVTLRSQSGRVSRTRGASDPGVRERERLHGSYVSVPPATRGPYVLLIALTLLIGVVSYGVVYLLIH